MTDSTQRRSTHSEFRWGRGTARRVLLGGAATAFLVATVGGLGAPSVAGAAGGDAGYGCNPAPEFGGSSAILVAKRIGHDGGSMAAPVHGAHLSVDIVGGTTVHTAQWIVTVSRHPSIRQPTSVAPRGPILLAFAVASLRHGVKAKTAQLVTITYAGARVTPSTHVSTDVSGTFTPVQSIVNGDSVTFAVPAGVPVAVFGN